MLTTILRRTSTVLLTVVAVVTALLTIAVQSASANGAGHSMYQFPSPHEKGLGVRVIRLHHAGRDNGTLISTFEHWNPDTGADVPYIIEQSRDHGQTWHTISTVDDGEQGPGRPWPTKWTPTLLELPTRVGKYPAGTIYLVGAVAGPGVNFELWRSEDHGHSWQYGGIIQQGSSTGGIWEPCLVMGPHQQLIVYFSDERDPAHSQKISEIVSSDGGQSWSAATDVVAAAAQPLRPGMPIATRLPDGRYALSFELVGAPVAAEARVKMSPDGLHWGNPADLGQRPETADHRYLASYPYIVWSPGGGPQGQLILSAGFTIDSRISAQAPEQGQTALVSYNLGKTWFRMGLPFKPTACDGTLWGASLLPSDNGSELRLSSPAGRAGSAYCGEFTNQTNVGTLPYRADFTGDEDPGWVQYGGDWTITNHGIYTENSNAAAKSLTGSTGWTDYTATATTAIESSAGTAGVLFRVTDPDANAADAFNGYEAAINSAGRFVLTRHTRDGDTPVELATTTSRAETSPGQWYTITIRAIGPRLNAILTTGGHRNIVARLSAVDPTYTTGQIGVETGAGLTQFERIAASAQ